jgi:hypothetical protein
MKRGAIAAAVLFVAQHVGAQCLGDFNGDGVVMINEIITAVNNSLNGCEGIGPTPTPVVGGCPIDFSDDNSQEGTADCFYVGPWNPSCGANDLQARWISFLGNNNDPSDDIVVVQLLGFSPPLFYGAGTTSSTSAELIGWYRQQDASDLHTAPGTLTLGDSGGTLELVPDAVPFQIESCDFAHYDGTLVEVSQPSAQAAAALRQQVDPAVLGRLRAARAERAGRPNLERR